MSLADITTLASRLSTENEAPQEIVVVLSKSRTFMHAPTLNFIASSFLSMHKPYVLVYQVSEQLCRVMQMLVDTYLPYQSSPTHSFSRAHKPQATKDSMFIFEPPLLSLGLLHT